MQEPHTTYAAATPAASERWRTDPGARPVWRNWGDAHYAFDPRSNQTHFLNTLAVEIFELMGSRPLTPSELAAALIADFDMDDTAELHEAVAATLNVLEHLGLVCRQAGA